MPIKPDIETMTRLKLVDLLFADAHDRTRFLLKQLIFETCGYVNVIVKPKQLELIEDPANEPKKGQYIRAFLNLGFRQEIIAEWFETSQANVSWHKTNPPKKDFYANQALQGLRELEHTLSEKPNNNTY
jgi:hypothetical protein